MKDGIRTIAEIIIVLVLLAVMVKCGSVHPAHPYIQLPTPSPIGEK